MEWELILSKLVEFVQTAGPQLWEIYKRQVYVEATVGLLQLVLFCVAAVVLFIAGTRSMRKYKEDGDTYSPLDVFAVAMWIGSGVFGFLVIVMTGDVIGRFANPDYYVIQALLEAVTR